uniref:TRP C-terminal domain-containing protein n=1 Tax=Vitrella brassicaformis TaxID=1169539 RepID=A0A7S1KBJ2_9ALVE
MLFPSIAALSFLVPLGLVTALLYNNFKPFSPDLSVQAHGRAEFWYTATKTLINLTFITSVSKPAWSIYCASINLVALGYVAILFFAQAPFYHNIANRMRDGILAVLLTIAVFALIREIRFVDDLLVVGVCLFTLPTGALLGLVRKDILRQEMAAETHSLMAVFNEDYIEALAALLAEETGEGGASRADKCSDERSDSTESVAQGEGGRPAGAIVPVLAALARPPSNQAIALGGSAITRQFSRSASVASKTVGNRRVVGAAAENQEPKSGAELVQERMSSY